MAGVALPATAWEQPTGYILGL